MKFDKLLDHAVEFAREEDLSLDEVNIDLTIANYGKFDECFTKVQKVEDPF